MSLLHRLRYVFMPFGCEMKKLLTSVGGTAAVRLERNSSSASSSSDFQYEFPSRDSLPEDIRKTIESVEEKAGFVPNVFSMLSRRPEEFRAFMAYHDALMEKETGNLTRADREMIVVATSAVNNCLYCIVAHGALMRIYSRNPYLADQVAANWKTADLDDRQRAILTFAMTICKPEVVTEDMFAELAAHGLDREDAWDIGSIASLFAMSNRLAFLSRLKPNNEFYLMGRVPREKPK